MALVLERREGQDILVKLPDGRELVIGVVSIKGGAVRIAVRAPADLKVDRAEVAQRRRAERGAV